MKDRATALRFGLTALGVIIAAHLVDGWFYANYVDADVYNGDWGRLLRIIGYLPTWVFAAVALVLHDWPRGRPGRRMPALQRGLLLLGGVAAGGIAAEILKLIFRRERPRAHDGEYFFRSFTDRPLHSGGLALPSSHALVAFAAAAMLSRLFPRAAPVWWLLAAGCGMTRVAAQAHFVSDIAVAGLVGWLVVALIWRRWGPGEELAGTDAAAPDSATRRPRRAGAGSRQ